MTILFLFICNAILGQSSTFVHKQIVSPYLDEWISKNNFYIVNNTINGACRIYTSLYDHNNNLVLGTDTPVYVDYYDTLSLYDTINAFYLFPIYRVYIDTPYASQFTSKRYLPYGSYSIKVVILDTNASIIDSFNGDFFIDSLIGPTLVSPKDNRKIYNQVSNNIPFTFNDRDKARSPFYKLIIKQVPWSFDFVESALESILEDSSMMSVVEFNINADDTSVSFNEYGLSPILNTDTLYVWAIREYKDVNRTIPITANNGFSTPFLLTLTGNSSATMLLAAEEFFDCNSSISGFEDGTLDGWVFGTGKKEAKIGGSNFRRADGLIIKKTGGVPVLDRHTLESTGSDPKVSGLPKVPVNGGDYSLRLGNSSMGIDLAEEAELTFTVSSASSIIKLRYACVFQDFNHKKKEQPIFRIRVFRTRTKAGINSFENLIEPIIKIPDENDPFFTKIDNTIIEYSPWNCQEINLGEFIGQTVTLEISTSHCAPGEHFGYAYVDFCGNPIAVASLAVNSTYCSGQEIIADGSASTNMTAWFYTVEECLNSSGTRFGAPEYISDWSHGFSIPNNFNITSFLSSKGVTLGCNKYYRIKLGGNNCNGWVENVKVIKIICPESNLAGPDRCVPSGTNSVQIGSNPKNGYTYSWSPSSCLSSSTIANPTFNKSLCPPQNYPLKYTLTSTYLGCSVNDEVYIYDNPPTITVTDVSINLCDRVYLATVSSGANLVSWYYEDENGGHVLTRNPVLIPVRPYPITITVWAYNPCGSTSTSFTQDAGASNNFWGPLPTLIAPTVMDPQNPSTRSLWVWEYGKDKGESPAYGLYWYDFRVYNRWGEKIYQKEEYKTSYSNGDIVWDGTSGGKEVMDGNYVWILTMENCANKGLNEKEKHTIMRLECNGTLKKVFTFWPPFYTYKCSGSYQWTPKYDQSKENITVLNYSY